MNLGGPLVSSHAALHPLLPSVGSLHQPSLSSIAEQHSSRFNNAGGASKRRRIRPRLLHPNGSGPEGVPSSLFTFQPPTGGEEGGTAAAAVTSTATISAVADETEALQARLVEESDLPEVSALLAEVRKACQQIAEVLVRALCSAYCTAASATLLSSFVRSRARTSTGRMCCWPAVVRSCAEIPLGTALNKSFREQGTLPTPIFAIHLATIIVMLLLLLRLPFCCSTLWAIETCSEPSQQEERRC